MTIEQELLGQLSEILESWLDDAMSTSALGVTIDDERTESDREEQYSDYLLQHATALLNIITDEVREAGLDELNKLGISFEEHPNWGYRDWHETNLMETILADRIEQLNRSKVE